MPYELSKSFYPIKKQISSKWWQFSGVAVIGLVFLVLLYSGFQEGKKTELYLKAPKPGDIYQIELEKDQYTTFKVSEVLGDTLHVYFNEWIVDDKNGFDKLLAKPYSNQVSSVSRTDLSDLKKEFKIHRIIREED